MVRRLPKKDNHRLAGRTRVCINRPRLTVLVHPETGYDLEDHRDRALWMGRVLDLKLDVLR